MGRRRFGNREIPPKILQAQKDATFGVPEENSLLCSTEAEKALWSYGDRGTDGALRLISVAKLLHPADPVIELREWSGLEVWPRDDLMRHGRGMPPKWPRYAAISHVWEPSEDAARISKDANRPLHIDIGGETPHTISWLGLVQAATAAKARRCKYLWLDLLCLNQRSRSDKAMQIKQMSKIYSNAAAVVVMVGGIAAAQGFDKHSSWINRAWTFQEATLGWPVDVLVDWSLPGSFSHFTKLEGDLATASLSALAEYPTGQSLGVSALVLKGKENQFECDLPLRCLGDDPAAIKALASALQIFFDQDLSEVPSESSSESSSDVDSFQGNHEAFSEASSSLNEEGPGDINHSSYQISDHGPGEGFNHTSTPFDGEPGQNSSDKEPGKGPAVDLHHTAHEGDSIGHDDEDVNSDLREDLNYLQTAYDSEPGRYYASDLDDCFGEEPNRDFYDTFSDSSDSFNEVPGNHALAVRPPSVTQHGAVWRSMWLRTSTKPQDLVFSMMHLLGVTIDVDYTRSLKELIFELVAKTSCPAWLTIGYDAPVYPESGLIPIPPTFKPNSNPTYLIDDKTLPASEIVLAGALCNHFDVVIKSTSTADGHLICAIMLDVKHSTTPEESQDQDSFYESELHLVAPGYEVHSKCQFKGRLGDAVVLVGDFSEPSNEFPLGEEPPGKPFVYLLGSARNGTWQKTGAGTLDEPLIGSYSSPRINRRHLQVGGHEGAELVPCDCDRVPRGPRGILANIQDGDLGQALADACSMGDVQRALEFIEMGADVNHGGGPLYGSPLIAACCNGKERMVQLLIKHGADVNIPEWWYGSSFTLSTEWHGTPLQAACRKNSESLARLLIENGADVNARGGTDSTALQKVVSLLLDNGAQINSTEGVYETEEGATCCTALEMACLHDSLGTVRILLERGADVNLRSNGTLHTALQAAAYYGRPLICKTLLDHGADVRISGGRFSNALQAAVATNYSNRFPGYCEQIVRLLFEKGADVNARGGYFGNALQAAAAVVQSNIPVVNLLLKKGADVNAVGGRYGTALQATAASGDKDQLMLQILLSHGADVNARGGQFGSALDAAISRAGSAVDEDRIVYLLRQAGARTVAEEDGLDPGELAAERRPQDGSGIPGQASDPAVEAGSWSHGGRKGG